MSKYIGSSGKFNVIFGVFYLNKCLLKLHLSELIIENKQNYWIKVLMKNINIISQINCEW